MKSILLFAGFLFCVQTSYPQIALECGYYGKKTIEERNALFPFNKAKKVVIVSYPNGIGMEEEIQKADSLTILNQYKAIRKLCFSLEGRYFCYLIKEEIVLSEDGVNRFSNILINYKLKKKPKKFEGLSAGTLCYNPHNTVLFYDENDTVIFCYEVCFECRNYSVFPIPSFEIDRYCIEAQINEVKKLFIDYGIKYLGNP